MTGRREGGREGGTGSQALEVRLTRAAYTEEVTHSTRTLKPGDDVRMAPQPTCAARVVQTTTPGSALHPAFVSGSPLCVRRAAPQQ